MEVFNFLIPYRPIYGSLLIRNPFIPLCPPTLKTKSNKQISIETAEKRLWLVTGDTYRRECAMV